MTRLVYLSNSIILDYKGSKVTYSIPILERHYFREELFSRRARVNLESLQKIEGFPS